MVGNRINESDCKIVVGIATYNEIENLPSLVAEIFAVIPNCHVFVVDDNSPDGTGQWCEQHSADQPNERLSCLHRPSKTGLGSAAIETIRFAVENDFDWLINLDADHSHNPAAIRKMLEIIHQGGETIDVVVGSRYVRGGKIVGWPWRRRLISRVVNWTARFGLGIPVLDTSGSFRCYRVTTLRRLDLDRLESVGYSIYEELLARLHERGAKMVEVPITFVERRFGKTKVGFRELFGSGFRLLMMIVKAPFR